MFRYGLAACLVGILAVTVSQSRTSAADDPVTFSKDVLPILQKNCQTCHRPGQMAPMSLLTFRDARPWARLRLVGNECRSHLLLTALRAAAAVR